MRYDTLLFDADDTLLDFHAAEKAALSRLFAAYGLQLTDALHAEYSAYISRCGTGLSAGS